MPLGAAAFKMDMEKIVQSVQFACISQAFLLCLSGSYFLIPSSSTSDRWGGMNSVSHKFVPTGTSDQGLIWKYGLYRCTCLQQAHTGLEWPPSPMTGVLKKRGEHRYT